MPTNLLLLPLLAGYWFINRQHYFRVRANRLDGYRLLPQSAIVGLLLVLLAWLTVGLAQRWPIVIKLWRDFAPEMPFLGTATVSLLLGLSLPYMLNWVLGKTG